METIHEKPPGLEATQQFFDSLNTTALPNSGLAGENFFCDLRLAGLKKK